MFETYQIDQSQELIDLPINCLHQDSHKTVRPTIPFFFLVPGYLGINPTNVVVANTVERVSLCAQYLLKCSQNLVLVCYPVFLLLIYWGQRVQLKVIGLFFPLNTDV